jgi:hypothetical protein
MCYFPFLGLLCLGSSCCLIADVMAEDSYATTTVRVLHVKQQNCTHPCHAFIVHEDGQMTEMALKSSQNPKVYKLIND